LRGGGREARGGKPTSPVETTVDAVLAVPADEVENVADDRVGDDTEVVRRLLVRGGTGVELVEKTTAEATRGCDTFGTRGAPTPRSPSLQPPGCAQPASYEGPRLLGPPPRDPHPDPNPHTTGVIADISRDEPRAA
jgi:hypothetical protein